VRKVPANGRDRGARIGVERDDGEAQLGDARIEIDVHGQAESFGFRFDQPRQLIAQRGFFEKYLDVRRDRKNPRWGRSGDTDVDYVAHQLDDAAPHGFGVTGQKCELLRERRRQYDGRPVLELAIDFRHRSARGGLTRASLVPAEAVERRRSARFALG